MADSDNSLPNLDPFRNTTYSMYDRLVELGEIKGGIEGQPTGFDTLDGILGGLKPGEVTLLAGRPSCGKTSLALSISLSVATHKDSTVVIFTPGNSSLQIVQRLVCTDACVDANRAATGRLNEDEWTALALNVDNIYDRRIYIDDTPQLDISYITERCSSISQQQSLTLVVINGLELMSAESAKSTRNDELTEIVRDLKVLARSLNLPLLVTCGIGRTYDRRPRLSDLPGWGTIEELVDNVIFLHTTGSAEIEASSESLHERHEAFLIVAKNANGPSGAIRMPFKVIARKFIDPTKAVTST